MPDLSPSSDQPPAFDPAADTAEDRRFDPSADTTRAPEAEAEAEADEEPGEGLVCPVCGTVAPPGARFCEIDGTVLGICACVDGGDGFCEKCGLKIPEGSRPAPNLGAATHVGSSHDTNQDAFALDRRDRIDAIVVCDGVSSSSHGEQAAAVAANAALAALLDAAGHDPMDAEGALRQAVRAGHRAACDATIELEPGMDPPGTTFVAAVVQRSDSAPARLDIAWVGDSRAYLVGPDHASLALTHDHSFVNMMVDGGAMTEVEAMKSPYAHAITHCMGPLESRDPEAAPDPSVIHVSADAGSRLIVCSDGLWNYFPTAEEIRDLVAAVPAEAEAGAMASALVNRALAMGGHDDITVAIAYL